MLLTLLLTLSASGFSAGFAASGGDDCCGEADEGEAQPSDRGAEDGQGKGGECPPFCHSCACAPLFEHPKPSAPRLVIWEPTFVTTFGLASEPPPGPPGPGVFHPPR